MNGGGLFWETYYVCALLQGEGMDGRLRYVPPESQEVKSGYSCNTGTYRTSYACLIASCVCLALYGVYICITGPLSIPFIQTPDFQRIVFAPWGRRLAGCMKGLWQTPRGCGTFPANITNWGERVE